MTAQEAVTIVKDEAAKRGVTWSDDYAYAVLWECTGWPSFFMGDVETEIRRQVGDVFDEKGER